MIASSTQPLPRGLQQRVADEQHEAAVRLEDPRDLLDRDIDRVDVLEGKACDHCIEAASPPRQRLGARPCVARSVAPPASLAHLAGRGIESRHLGTQTREVPCDLALAAADVEDAPGTRDVAGDQGQDLVLVFGIDARR